jgi:hypothetical protein
MVFIGYTLLIVGAVLGFVGVVMLLTAAYRRSIWWMLACLFIPPVYLIFLFVAPKTAAKPFAIALAGIFLECFGASLAGIEW